MAPAVVERAVLAPRKEMLNLQGPSMGISANVAIKARPLSLDVELFFEPSACQPASCCLGTFTSRLEGELRFLLASCRFTDAQVAAEALCAYVLAPPTEDAPHVQVKAVTMKVIPDGAELALCGLQVCIVRF